MSNKSKRKKKANSTVADGSEFQVWAYTTSTMHDAEIRIAAQAESFGSGYGPEGRDISFYAETEADAMAMKDRLLKLPFIVKVEVTYPTGFRTFANRKKPKQNKWKAYETYCL